MRQPPVSLLEKILAIVIFVLLLGAGLVFIGGLFFASGWCCAGCAYVKWDCVAPLWGLALLTLIFISGGTFFMFRRRYALALSLMAITPVIWLGIVATGGF